MPATLPSHVTTTTYPSIATYPSIGWMDFHVASHARYKEFHGIKWTEEKLVEAVCSFPCRGRKPPSATSAFLTKGYGTPFVDAVCKILQAPKHFFGDISFYAVNIGPNLVKHKYSFSSIFTAVERIPRDKQVGVAA